MTLERLTLSPNRHFLATQSGQPFFWLGDTGWNAIHRLTREEAAHYLDTRARQGFNVVQVMGVSEQDGITPSAYGQQAFIDNDPTRPNETYFQHVDAFLNMAAERGLYVAFLPTWGHHVLPMWSSGPAFFTEPNARVYGEFLGRRYANQTNLIWVLGGDRPAVHGEIDTRPLWRAMAEGIQSGLRAGGHAGGGLFTYHPSGENSTSQWLNEESWLDIHMMQSGHGGGPDRPNWEWVERDYNLQPARPVLDGEPNYEDHPIRPWPTWAPEQGYYRDYDTRKAAYRSVFAGACGVTYGHHSVWQFYGPSYEPINHPDRTWMEALPRPGAEQMRHLRRLIESRPSLERVPDQALLDHPAAGRAEHPRAFRDAKRSYIMVYTPIYGSVAVHTDTMRAFKIRAWWYNPRSGAAQEIGVFPGRVTLRFTTPLDGPDWALVLDDISAGYGAPGSPLDERAA